MNTIGLLTPTVTSAANSLVMTDASGYIRATRIEVGGSTYYIDKAGANVLRIMAANSIDFGAGGADQIRLEDGTVWPKVTDDVNLGTTIYRWKLVAGIAGNFSGDVTIGTAGKGLIMSNNTSGYVPIADGTRYVPGAISKAMLPTHAHGLTYTSTDSANWVVYGAINNTGNPLRDGSGTQVFLLDSAIGYSDDATHSPVYIGTQPHAHKYDKANTPTGSTII